MISSPLSPPSMHAPDGFFAIWLAVVGWIILIGVIALALRNTREQLGERQVPLMGVLAAAIFAGQMINFTIPGGTSGHLLGGALAAIILGPWAAVLIMTAVIAVQALVFQDGGLVVMGLNIINMGVITAFIGYFAHKSLISMIRGKNGLYISAFVAGWLSVIVTSAFTAVELALSGASALQFALPAMVGVHALIGIGEGLLTAFALSFIATVRPDLLAQEGVQGQRSAAWISVGLVLALAITLLAPLASPYSDGLERVAEALSSPEAVEVDPVAFSVPADPQFFGEAQSSPYDLLPDYTIPFLGEGAVSTIAAGMIGVLVVFAVAFIFARLAKGRNEQQEPTGSAGA